MAYILNKTNGSVVTTLSNGSIDKTTDLTFVGKNYAGYGEVINEDLLRLLENFANGSEPPKPIVGQLWYDTTAQILRFFDGNAFRRLSVSAPATGDVPEVSALNTGDFWWDSTHQVLKVFNGVDFVTIGPKIAGLDDYFMFNIVVDDSLDLEHNKHIIVEHKIFDDLVAVVSSSTFHINITDYTPADDLIYNQDNWHWIRKGITLTGADRLTGVTTDGSNDGGSILWGTAADALRLHGRLASVPAIEDTIVQRSTDGSVYTNNLFAANTATVSGALLIGSTATNSLTVGGGATFGRGITIGSTSTIAGDLYGVVFHGIATAAYYADLAERYHADAVYDAGTVLVIGGLNEVTITAEHASVAVAGIVSKNPAFMMNSEAGTDDSHPYIALKGRIPCKVVGTVLKGDILVTSTTPGYACAADLNYAVHPAAIIGKALESNSQGFGLVEVKV